VSSTVLGSRNPFHGMRRYPDNGVIAGVCEGLAVHFDWSPRVVRVIAVLLLIFTAFWPTVVAYCLAWYIIDPVPGMPPSHGVPPAASAGAAPGAGPAPSGASVPMPELKARFAKLDERLRDIEECVTDKEFELRRELKKLEA
jgi:phage shock protein C